MEAGDDPLESGQGCVEQLSSLSYSDVLSCAQGAEGNSLEHEMGVKTESLSPSHTFVPWIVVNGQHDDKIQMRAMQDLLALVCDLYQGAKPQQCIESEVLELIE